MIKVEKEPPEIEREFMGVLEHCFFCKLQTRYWHLESNTPVCPACAAGHDVREVLE